MLGLNPIVATLGTNALLYGAVLEVSSGIPRTTTDRLENAAGGRTLGIPNAVYYAVAATVVVTVVVKLTPAGRRFEAVGSNSLAALTSGLRVKSYRASGYVWAQLFYWLGAVLLAGIVKQPTAFQGDAYLLPSVAAVVLGGTSLLGGRGNLVATAVAALFLSQLEQFVLALGVTFAVRTLVEAAALAVGVALYTLDWRAIGRRLGAAPGRTRGRHPPDDLRRTTCPISARHARDRTHGGGGQNDESTNLRSQSRVGHRRQRARARGLRRRRGVDDQRGRRPGRVQRGRPGGVQRRTGGVERARRVERRGAGRVRPTPAACRPGAATRRSSSASPTASAATAGAS